jgi:hypothetical protein
VLSFAARVGYNDDEVAQPGRTVMDINVQLVLVILLGVGYTLLLIMSLVAVYIVIRILQSIRHIARNAEMTTDNMSEVVKMVGKRIAPVAMSGLAGAVFKFVNDKRKGAKE